MPADNLAHECPRDQPEVDRAHWLKGADFADAFRIVIAGAAIDAREAATRMVEHSLRWVER